jgi:hypothetical protein
MGRCCSFRLAGAAARGSAGLLLSMQLSGAAGPLARAPQAREKLVVEHVDALISATKRSGLPKNEIESLRGSLQWLRSESIGQAGRKLAARLGNRRYADQPPPAFFSKCYELRSSLVHGAHPRPAWGEVGQRAAALELFVRDLLSLELLDEFPEA